MKRSRVVDLTDDSTDVVVASWACAYCTFAHGDAEALFLACSACGQPRSKVAAAARDDDGSLALARTPHEQGSRDVAQRFLENRARAALGLRPRTRALRRRAAPRPIRADIVVLREDEVLLARLSGPSRG